MLSSSHKIHSYVYPAITYSKFNLAILSYSVMIVMIIKRG